MSLSGACALIFPNFTPVHALTFPNCSFLHDDPSLSQGANEAADAGQGWRGEWGRGAVGQIHFPQVESAEQSIDSLPAYVFILIAVDCRPTTAVLPSFNLTSSSCTSVKNKKNRKGSFPLVHFPRVAFSDQSSCWSSIQLSAFNKYRLRSNTTDRVIIPQNPDIDSKHCPPPYRTEYNRLC